MISSCPAKSIPCLNFPALPITPLLQPMMCRSGTLSAGNYKPRMMAIHGQASTHEPMRISQPGSCAGLFQLSIQIHTPTTVYISIPMLAPTKSNFRSWNLLAQIPMVLSCTTRLLMGILAGPNWRRVNIAMK